MKICPHCGGRVIQIRTISIECSKSLYVKKKTVMREEICRKCRSELKVKRGA